MGSPPSSLLFYREEKKIDRKMLLDVDIKKINKMKVHLQTFYCKVAHRSTTDQCEQARFGEGQILMVCLFSLRFYVALQDTVRLKSLPSPRP